MVLMPTAEQQAAREMFAAGGDLALVAGAGTGKTSTLVLMGQSTPRRGLYVAFNKSIADDAKSRFGSNVECRTAHSLAFQSVGRNYRERISRSARVPAWQTARRLGIDRDLPVNSTRITVKHQARLVMGMVRRFCYTTDRQLMARHLEWVNGLDTGGQDFVARELLPYAARAWEDLQDPGGELRFEHDHYMKMWALTSPVLGADFVLLDEAQDTNPVLEEVFLNQKAQRVCVGDPAQQIYAWRAAKDVMTAFPAEHLELTQSFRFGPGIAAVANRWLCHAESPMRLAGCGPESRIGPVVGADAVLCRTNADALREVIGFLDDGVPVALAGGGAAMERIAQAALELKAGKRTSHPELFLFSSWGEVQEYVEQDSAGSDLKAIVQLVDTHGPEAILAAAQRLTPEEQAKVTVSTAHKAKGREWDTVRIAGGFEAPPLDEDGLQAPLSLPEARLAYVAVTRACRHLDMESMAWLDAYEKTLASGPGAGGRPLLDLSLTGQLKHLASPMSRFMEQHLPDARHVAGDYLKRLPPLPRPVQPLDVAHPKFDALGHAIDYRLRLSLGRDMGGAVAAGVDAMHPRWELPGAPAPKVRSALHTAGVELLDLTRRHLDSEGTYLDEDTLSRLCFVAASYEDIYRIGRVHRFSFLTRADEHTTLRRLTDAVDSYVPDDLAVQMRLAQEPFAALRALPEAQRVCGPVFAGSGDIGGADADFVLGGLLIDCKATTRPRQLGVAEIYQLAGYLLLDYDDEFGIDRVGLYLSRQGHLITWTVPDFLLRLGTTTPLPTLRHRLRDFLHTEAAALASPIGNRVR